jgi:pectin methylesterase-like acyl-CoA thioesterase
MRKLLLICLALCVMFMLVGVTFAADSTTVNGVVSDSKCGAKNAGAKGAECTKKCIAAGAKMVVVTDGDQKVLTVENPDALTGHEGHHVAVTGAVTGDSMHVDTVKMIEKSAM